MLAPLFPQRFPYLALNKSSNSRLTKDKVQQSFQGITNLWENAFLITDFSIASTVITLSIILRLFVRLCFQLKNKWRKLSYLNYLTESNVSLIIL